MLAATLVAKQAVRLLCMSTLARYTPVSLATGDAEEPAMARASNVISNKE